MYYYLIYNSSIGNHYELEKRYLTTILYASILYILTHAFLSSSQSEFAKKIRNYFWMIFILDCCSMSYIYYFDSDSDQHTENNLVDNILNQINNVKNKLNNTILSNPKKNSSNGRILAGFCRSSLGKPMSSIDDIGFQRINDSNY